MTGARRCSGPFHGVRRLTQAVVCAAAVASPVAAQSLAVGESVANPAVLGRLFAAACLQSGSLPETLTMLAEAGMVLNPRTGTYFHPHFNMSVNPTGDLCSMVFLLGSPATDPVDFRASAATMVGAGADAIEIIQIEGQSEPYFRASVEGRW